VILNYKLPIQKESLIGKPLGSHGKSGAGTSCNTQLLATLKSFSIFGSRVKLGRVL
jgi:hypothetical protein